MKIVVPIMPASLDEAKALSVSHYDGADIIDWTVTAPLSAEAVLEMAPVIFETFAGFEVMFSYQATDGLAGEELVTVIKTLQELFHPDYIHLTSDQKDQVLEPLRSFTNLVLSYTDLDGVPKDLVAICSELTALAPRVVKLVLTPKTEQEVLEVMTLIRGFKALNPEQIYYCICQGELGQITQVFSDFMGSQWTQAYTCEETSSVALSLAALQQVQALLTR